MGNAQPTPIVQWSEVIVIGSGMAGLITALKLAPMPVTLLTKTAVLEGGSSLLAQGGVAAAIGPGDSPQDHAIDTVAAGAGLCDEAMARLLVARGAEDIAALLADGLPFDRAPDGAPLLGREAAHGRARILHAGGDATGRTLVQALAARVRLTPSITVVAGAFATDLIMVRDRPCGLLAYHPDRAAWVFHVSPRIVLATGGAGGAFLHTTNPPEATADGLAMAARAGARLADVEFIQFHPTALAVPGAGPAKPLPLLTEALRGAGAKLIDSYGQRFMLAEHPAAELAPRDVVARAVWRRVVAGNTVYLDCRQVLAGGGIEHFPTVAGICAEAGLDPQRELLPVVPAAHYLMGGVLTDDHGRTTLPGLWACGEVAGTGVHGANRLASNSLLEALVFAGRVAEDVRERGLPPLPPMAPPQTPMIPAGGGAAAALDALRLEIRRVMSERMGLIRDAGGLAEAEARLVVAARRFVALPEPPVGATLTAEDVLRWGEVRNLLLFARLAAHAAHAREESRGAHYRTDHPQLSSDWRHRQVLSIHDLECGPNQPPAVVPTSLPTLVSVKTGKPGPCST
ncbi:L-aspartate oxidase [uncultured Gammaproteobacteria bacterium]